MVTEKEYERLRRDRNLFQMENTRLNKKLLSMEGDYERFEKCNKVLVRTEDYLHQRIEKIKNIPEYNVATTELQKLSNALEFERKRIFSYEEENEEF